MSEILCVQDIFIFKGRAVVGHLCSVNLKKVEGIRRRIDPQYAPELNLTVALFWEIPIGKLSKIFLNHRKLGSRSKKKKSLLKSALICLGPLCFDADLSYLSS